MERLELIDITSEDDNLLPSSSSPENVQAAQFLFPISPTEVTDTKDSLRDEDQQISPAGKMAIEMDSKLIKTSKTSFKQGPSLDSALSVLDVNTRDDVKPAHSKPLSGARGTKGGKAGKKESSGGKSVAVAKGKIHSRTVSWSESASKVSKDAKLVEEASRPLSAKSELQSQQGNKHDSLPIEALPAESLPTEQSSTMRTRTARALTSLRKSLAWDKAFFTDEGVLDPEELPFVSRTSKKLPELVPLDIPQILSRISPSSSSVNPPSCVSTAISDSNRTAHNQYEESRIAPTTLQKTDAANTEKGSVAASGSLKLPPLPTLSQVNGVQYPLDLTLPRPVPVNQVIEAAIQKGTRLRLPSTFSITSKKSKEKSAEEPVKPVTQPPKDLLTRCSSTSSLPKPVSSSSSLSKKVASVSKKVKDTLGKVMPGRATPSPKQSHAAAGSHNDNHHSTTKVVESPQVTPRPLSSSSGRFMTSPGPSTLTRCRSARAVLSGPSVETPSNLPKINVLGEVSNRVGGANSSANPPGGGNPKASSNPKRGSIWGNFRGKVSNRANSDRLGTTSESPLRSVKAGAAPLQVPMQEDSSQAAENSLPKVSGLRLPSAKLGFFDSGRAPQSSLASENGLSGLHSRPQGLPPRPQCLSSGRAGHPPGDTVVHSSGSGSSCIPSAPHLRTVSQNTAEQENRMDPDSTGSLCKPKPMRTPRSKSDGMETLSICAPFSEERICYLEAAGEEIIQMKSGAVQHSPPNKIEHKPNNPWSPVRRNGQQLGPFDCTKKYTSVSIFQ